MRKLLAIWVAVVLATVAEAQASAFASYAYGSGISRATVGETAYFSIQTVDIGGYNLTVGGGAFKIQMKGPNNANAPKPTLVDLGTGLYQGSYVVALTDPPITGIYTLEIYMDVNGAKTAIKDSPFSIIVVELAPLDPSKCVARMLPDAVTAGVKSQIAVIARDVNGNVLTQGNSNFIVSLSQGGVAAGEATTEYTNQDGEYLIEFVATKSGTPLLVNVRAGNPASHIGGSPFSIFVHPGNVFPANCDATGPAFEVGGKQGDLLTFLIIEQDAWNNDRFIPSPNSVVTAYFQDDAAPISIARNKNGTFTASFIAPKGQHSIVVKMDGIEISGSPFLVNFEGAGLFSGSGGVINGGIVGAVCALVGFAIYKHKSQEAVQAPSNPSTSEDLTPVIHTPGAQVSYVRPGETDLDSDDSDTGVF